MDNSQKNMQHIYQFVLIKFFSHPKTKFADYQVEGALDHYLKCTNPLCECCIMPRVYENLAILPDDLVSRFNTTRNHVMAAKRVMDQKICEIKAGKNICKCCPLAMKRELEFIYMAFFVARNEYHSYCKQIYNMIHPRETEDVVELRPCDICAMHVPNKDFKLYQCGHTFCHVCSDKILLGNMPKCPNCRANVSINMFVGNVL